MPMMAGMPMGPGMPSPPMMAPPMAQGPGMGTMPPMPLLGYHPQLGGAPPSAVYPQPYPQMMQPPMGQFGYPQMGPDGSIAGMYQPQPGVMAMGYAPGTIAPKPGDRSSSSKSRVWENFSYLDDCARAQGWVLSQLARVFHERNNALKVCIPSGAFAVFFVIFSLIMVVDIVQGDVDATLQQCKVARTQLVDVPRDGATTPKYRPTVYANVVGRPGERAITRFKDPGDYEVEREEAEEYLHKFCIGCEVPCYEFDDGEFQLDSSEYHSVWNYVIMVILCASAFVCCCIWLASGTFACCSPLITVTLQA